MVKPKLTPEEKKALRLQKKQEKKLKALERKKQLKRDYLLREIKYTSVTVAKYDKEWRQMLINISVPSIRKELQFAWHNFERVVDCKDFTISLLMDELRDAQEQYLMNFRNHLQSIEDLIDMFHNQNEELHYHNEMQVKKLRDEMNENVEMIKKESDETEVYLKTMLYGLEMERKNESQKAQVDYFLKQDDLTTTNTNAIQRLRGFLEQMHYKVWEDTKSFYSHFKKSTKSRRKTHDELKHQDDKLQELLAKQIQKLGHNYNYLNRLRTKFVELKKERVDTLNQLTKTFNYFDNAFVKMRKILKTERDFDFNQLLILSMKYNETIQYLNELKSKGKLILQLNSVCKKLETFQEKIMPFPCILPERKVVQNVTESTIDVVLTSSELLSFFWQKIGLIEASKYSINEEKRQLQVENEELKGKLRKICKCPQKPET